MRKAIATLLLLLLPSLCQANWIQNPYTGKKDYYQVGSGVGNTLTTAGLTVIGSGASTTSPWLDPVITIRNSDTTVGNYVGINFPEATGAYEAAYIGARINVQNPAAPSGSIIFLTTNAGAVNEKMTILPNGNVGIGTTNPGNNLYVIGYAQADYLVTNNQLYFTTSTYNYIDCIDGASGKLMFTSYRGGYTPNLTILTASGNVGIGTTAPTQLLEIAGAGSKVKVYSPNGTGYSCGVANGGAWSCS